MREDAASKAERYRKAANKYAELAKTAEPDYLAEVFRKVAVRYVFMAEDVLRAERQLDILSRSQPLSINERARAFLDWIGKVSGATDAVDAHPPSFYVRECVMSSEDVVPPLAANMNAAFKKVRGAIGATDPALADLIVTRIVELAKDGVYDIEELSSRTLSSLKLAG
jgi:hypothetical protein